MSNRLHPTDVLGSYRLDALLGQGGMAQVWKAWHGGLHRFEALKVLPPQMTFDRSFVERFLAEARTAANLNHPHIAAIHAVSSDDAQPYFTMELVEGGDLSDLIAQKGRFSLQEAIPILRQIGEALDYAHSRGLIHRDVKPANIMLTPDGRVKMVDFGIARAQEEPGGTRLTKTGMILGTPDYMSPEQGGSGAPVDHRSDIYSLGVIAYEMLCGKPPFHAGSQTSAIAVIMEHIRTPPPSPRSLNPALSPGVARALETALSKEPGARPASCAEFLAALEGKASSGLAPTKPQKDATAQGQKRSSPWPLVAGGVAFVGLALIGVAIGRGRFSGDNPSVQMVLPAPVETELQARVTPATSPTTAQPESKKPQPALMSAPDLLGMRESQARAAAASNGLKIAVTTGSSQSVAAGEVMGQNPSPKIAVARGATVTIRVSTGSGADSAPAAPRVVVTRRQEESEESQEEPPPVQLQWPSPDAPAYTSPLSLGDLSGKSSEELTLMRNTIYARYGRRFRRSDLQSYFNSQSWYRPNPKYRDSLLTRVEKRNAALISSAQKGNFAG